MKPDIQPVDLDEPAVTNPELKRLVELARQQPPPPLQVTPEQIHRGWRERRAQRYRKTTIGVLATAAAAALILVTGPFFDAPEQRAPVIAVQDQPTAPPTPELTPEPVQPPPEKTAEAPSEPQKLALDETIRVQPVVEGSEAPEVLGAWAIRVQRGSGYEIEVPEDSEESLRIAMPSGELELEHGVVVLLLTGPEPEIQLKRGRAVLIDGDGNRTVLLPDDGQSAEASKRERRPGPADLARRAERHVAAGDRDAAIETLSALVDRYPRSSHARTGLLDLARLLKAAGRRDAASCAYQTFEKRWPYTQLQADVEQALDRLGRPECNGLQPQ